MPVSVKSRELYQQACKLIPGGVNSPVRAFKGLGRDPIFIRRAEGSRLYDVDGNSYIDFVNSWGPLLLGHSHPAVKAAVLAALEDGTSYGAPTEKEIVLARLITGMMPAVEMVRLVSSGTEATMSAVRLARAFTHREKIIKIEGCYHGHGDSFLIKAGSGLTTLGEPNSPGVPRTVSADTLIAPFNDAAAVEGLFEAYPDAIAALIVEPVPANMGVILPAPGYLAALRDMTREYGSLLIFDEVITGFRVHPGGAQAHFGVTPDLTTLGKIIGGGLPIGAFGGRREIMSLMSPQGPVYQAGTLSGNPLAVSAGIATLATIRDENVIDAVNAKAEDFHRRVAAVAAASGVALCTNRIGSMSTLFFQTGPVRNYQEAVRSDPEQFKVFFNAMLDQGIYVAPSQYEAAFVSLAHTPQDLDDACRALETALVRVREMAG